MRILIADDDECLRELLADVLAADGHEVVACANGEEALRTYTDADGKGFDYVVTDYQMPRKNGVVLIMGVRAKNPSQKCVLVSGDPPTLSAAVRKDTGEFPVLRKPYRNEELLALLR